MEQLVSTVLIKEMRDRGVISTDEVLYEVGDLYVAENVVTRERRVVREAQTHMSENKRVLKG